MGDRPSSHLNRRQVLATMAGMTSMTSIAGCSLLQDQTGVGDSGATDVIVHNIASELKTVSITITDTEAENPHTSKTLEVSPEEIVDPVNSGKLPTNTSGYTVEVSIKNGPTETFEWTNPTVQLAPLWVQIDGTRNILFLLQAA